MTDTKFWLSDFRILYNNLDFYPNKNMSRNELLNSLSRYSFIILIVFFFIGSSFNWFFFPIGIIISCVILFLLDIQNQEEKKLQKEKDSYTCREPNINNPYMNILVTQNNVDLPACDIDKPKISKEVDKLYKFNLYQNSSDIFDRKSLERQFYTMPVSTIPNKQGEYVNWLYKKDGNCKANDFRCLEYEDERYH